VRVLKVLSFAEQRGSADDARLLCESLEAVPRAGAERAAPTPAAAEGGTGRLGKRHRPALRALAGAHKAR
jgi:hypothetical protein